MRHAGLVTVAVVLALGGTSCLSGPQVRAELRPIREDVEKARSSGAERCAPRELALAEAHADFADAELDRGNFWRANDHMKVAQDNAREALDKSKGCGPKRVLISEKPKPVPKTPPVIIRVEKTDADGDGITDDVDQCINEPEDRDGFQDEDGCPDPDNDNDGVLDPEDDCPNEPGPASNRGCPVTDRDGDGVLDGEDACPDEPGPVERKGCPFKDRDGDGVEDAVDACPDEPGPAERKGCPLKDRDNDGIPDDVDRCPNDPEDMDGFEDQDGCPDLDNDKDGLVDSADKCPNEPGPPTNQGCPVVDTDGDGIMDDVDKCPNEFGVPEEQGCPKKYSLIVVKEDKIEIKQQVHFAKTKAVILKDSFPLLVQVSDAIKSGKIKKVLIEGHTDSDGTASRNLKLSQDRADAVRDFMIKKGGVAPDVLEAIGFGQTRPIASNKTAKGKALNRRVEFKIIER